MRRRHLKTTQLLRRVPRSMPSVHMLQKVLFFWFSLRFVLCNPRLSLLRQRKISSFCCFLAFCLADSGLKPPFCFIISSSHPFQGTFAEFPSKKSRKKRKVGEPSLCKKTLVAPGVIISCCSSIKEQRFLKKDWNCLAHEIFPTETKMTSWRVFVKFVISSRSLDAKLAEIQRVLRCLIWADDGTACAENVEYQNKQTVKVPWCFMLPVCGALQNLMSKLQSQMFELLRPKYSLWTLMKCFVCYPEVNHFLNIYK